eukprot:scaffold3553_cov180-Ochromonas_danica.AAC.16
MSGANHYNAVIAKEEIEMAVELAEHANHVLGTGDTYALAANASSKEDAATVAATDNDRTYSYDLSAAEDGNYLDEGKIPIEVPNMWSLPYIGLYCQYASVGLLYGTSGTLLPFCAYVFKGASNVCANASNIVFFAWSFKIWFAIFTDSFRPFGLRRKPWMLGGWCCVLIMLLALAIKADTMDDSSWMLMLLFTQCFVMLSDVPADGYCVELGQLESKENRGQILATGQRIRFTFCMVSGFIQTFLLNGPTTNSPGCPIDSMDCWSWGLTINQYYGMLLAIVGVLTIPIFFLKEIENPNIPDHSWSEYFKHLWETLKNKNTLCLLIFATGSNALTNITNNAAITLQYYIIKLTNFQAGIDTITTYAALVLAIWIFQRFLINRNWRHTQLLSTIATRLLGLLWLLSFYNTGGLMDPWFTIFIDLDQSFVSGLNQVLYSMAVIELAMPGLEATTYELIITVGNAAQTVSGIIGTQLLTPLNAVTCSGTEDTSTCVDASSRSAYFDSDGPDRFMHYTLVLMGIGIGCCFVFVPFLPASKEECKEWKEKGERAGGNTMRAICALILAACVVGYGVACASLLLNTKTSCEPAVGGSGC